MHRFGALGAGTTPLNQGNACMESQITTPHVNKIEVVDNICPVLLKPKQN